MYVAFWFTVITINEPLLFFLYCVLKHKKRDKMADSFFFIKKKPVVKKYINDFFFVPVVTPFMCDAIVLQALSWILIFSCICILFHFFFSLSLLFHQKNELRNKILISLKPICCFLLLLVIFLYFFGLEEQLEFYTRERRWTIFCFVLFTLEWIFLLIVIVQNILLFNSKIYVLFVM